MEFLNKFVKDLTTSNSILYKSIRTFGQAFIGSVAIQLQAGISLDKTVILSMLGSAISAGVCALMNYLSNPK